MDYKIATEAEARTIGGSSASITAFKCTTKTRAIALGCTLISPCDTYANNRLVRVAGLQSNKILHFGKITLYWDIPNKELSVTVPLNTGQEVLGLNPNCLSGLVVIGIYNSPKSSGHQGSPIDTVSITVSRASSSVTTFTGKASVSITSTVFAHTLSFPSTGVAYYNSLEGYTGYDYIDSDEITLAYVAPAQKKNYVVTINFTNISYGPQTWSNSVLPLGSSSESIGSPLTLFDGDRSCNGSVYMYNANELTQVSLPSAQNDTKGPHSVTLKSYSDTDFTATYECTARIYLNWNS